MGLLTDFLDLLSVSEERKSFIFLKSKDSIQFS